MYIESFLHSIHNFVNQQKLIAHFDSNNAVYFIISGSQLSGSPQQGPVSIEHSSMHDVIRDPNFKCNILLIRADLNSYLPLWPHIICL